MRNCINRIFDMTLDMIVTIIKDFLEVTRILVDIVVKILIAPFAIAALMLILLAFFKNEE